MLAKPLSLLPSDVFEPPSFQIVELERLRADRFESLERCTRYWLLSANLDSQSFLAPDSRAASHFHAEILEERTSVDHSEGLGWYL